MAVTVRLVAFLSISAATVIATDLWFDLRAASLGSDSQKKRAYEQCRDQAVARHTEPGELFGK